MTYLPKGRRTQHVGANRCAQSRPGTSWQRWECKQTGRSPNAYPVGRSYDVIIQTGRTGRRLFFSLLFRFPSFSVPLFGLPPACRLALSVYLQRILFLSVLSLPFLSVLRTGEEYHARRASRRQRSCKKRANGNASVVASRPPRRHTRARRGGFRRAESRRECCELQISIFTSVPKPFTLPFWSFIFNRAHSLHPIKRAN